MNHQYCYFSYKNTFTTHLLLKKKKSQLFQGEDLLLSSVFLILLMNISQFLTVIKTKF